MKIQSSLINTFRAHLQKVLDTAPDRIDDSTIFSSWLGLMVTGTVQDRGIEGSFEEHVLAAVSYISCHPRTILDFIIEQCRTGTKEWLLTRTCHIGTIVLEQ